MGNKIMQETTPLVECSAFHRGMSVLEASLRNTEDSETIISGLLKGAAEFYGASRASVVEADWDLGIGVITYEWCKDGVSAQRDMLQCLPMEKFPRWRKALRANKPVVISDLQRLENVYTDADGNLIRLTRDDFSNEEEFLRWKKISDMDYHGEEKVDHLYYDGTLPLESLAEEVIAVPSAEEGYITEIDLSERHLLENLLLEGMGTKLTERQRTRLWLYCINGVTAAEIASFEGIAQQNVSKSIASAKKKLKKFLKNRV